MGGTIGANNAGTIDREADRQLLDRDIADDLVVGALQESGIDRGKRLETLGGEASGEGHRMLFGDADASKVRSGNTAASLLRPVPSCAAGDADDLLAEPRFLDQLMKTARYRPSIGLGLGLGASRTSNLLTPWRFARAAASQGIARCLPFWVTT